MVEYIFRKGTDMCRLLTDNTLNQKKFTIIEAVKTTDDKTFDRSYLIGNFVQEEDLIKKAVSDGQVLEKWSDDTLYDILNGFVMTKTTPTNMSTDQAVDLVLSWVAVAGVESYELHIGKGNDPKTIVTLPSTVTSIKAATVLGLDVLANSSVYHWFVCVNFKSGVHRHDNTPFTFTTVAA